MRHRAAVTALAILLALFVGTPPSYANARAAPPKYEDCTGLTNDRFFDCRSGRYSWTLFSEADPETEAGWVTMDFTIRQRLSPDSRQWRVEYFIKFVDVEGIAAPPYATGTTGTTVKVIPECIGECIAQEAISTSDCGAESCAYDVTAESRQPVVRDSVLTGDIEFESPGPGKKSSKQRVSVFLFNPSQSTSGTTREDRTWILGPVRCDDAEQQDALGANGRPGCVMSDIVPTFALRSPEWSDAPTTEHNEFVARAQDDPKTAGWGKPGAGKPLVREYLPRREQASKRGAVCPESWPRNPSPPGTARQDRDSCDEYPYSSTRQGVPTYAVTGHVPQGVNSRAGGRLSTFYARNHILDGDPFFVQP